MKKLNLLLVAVLLFSFSVVSAKTIVAGKIYNADYSDTYANATVNVTCNSYMKSNLSNGDGTYVITFTDGQCNVDDVVNVSASLGSLYGFKNGSVLNGTLFDIPLDVAVVNVPLVPEFGFYAAILTVLSAVGIFFVVRKN